MTEGDLGGRFSNRADGARRLYVRAKFALLVSASVFLSALVGYTLRVPASGISAIWPASGVLLATLLLWPRRDWLLALIAAFVGNFAADVFHGLAPATAAAGSFFNAFESFVAASVITRLVGVEVTFGTLRQVGALVIGAALVSNGLTALLGAFVLTGWTLNHLGRSWLVWWVGDGLGILVFTPVVLTIARLINERVRLRRGQWVEMAVVLLAIGALTHGLLRVDPSASGATASPVYAVFPLLIWAAVRQGPWAAASAVAVLSLVVMYNVAYTPDLFGHGGASDLRQVVHLYVYIALASISAIVPAAIMQERRTVESRLRTSERRFRQMAEHIREAFFVLDIGSRTPIYTSPTWAAIWVDRLRTQPISERGSRRHTAMIAEAYSKPSTMCEMGTKEQWSFASFSRVVRFAGCALAFSQCATIQGRFTG